MPDRLTKFVHPQKAFRLQYPAEWENLMQDEGRSCGFGPRDRNDVGLWISILPASIDSDRLAEDLPQLFEQSLKRSKVTNIRRDGTLNHHAMKADMAAEGQGGHYWLIVGGDLVLFASSQVPPAERDIWNPAFGRVMESLEITRDKELLLRKIGFDVLQLLKQKHPDQDYRWEEQGIRGRDHVVYLSNLFRDVQRHPDRKDEIIKRFVENLVLTPEDIGYEEWADVQDRIVPVLKPKAYVKPEGPTRHMLTSEWLADVLICYAISAEKTFRFVTGWDCDRWGVTSERLHEVAIWNLTTLPWPHMMEGSRDPAGGRIVLVHTNDSFSASRLLHPDFHKLFAKGLGSPFLAGIPDRDTLVAFSNRQALKKRIARQVRKDYNSSSYSITPRIFLVTADGVALADPGK
jgi:uncharacterized protein YtpQ (UPF0354 family)